MSITILGISAYYRDSAAAALLVDGEITAAVQEERFTRKKHDPGFPAYAIRYYATGLTMTNGQFDRLFGGPSRESESEVTQREMDIACSIQAVTEEISLSQLIRSVCEKYDVLIIDTPAAGNSVCAYIIIARAKAGPIVARRNVTRVARLEALVERIGVARAAMLGIVRKES